MWNYFLDFNLSPTSHNMFRMRPEPLLSGLPSHGRMWAVTVTVWNGRISFCTWRQHEGAWWNWNLIQKESLWRSLLLPLCGVALSSKSTSLAFTDMTYWQKIHLWPREETTDVANISQLWTSVCGNPFSVQAKHGSARGEDLNEKAVSCNKLWVSSSLPSDTREKQLQPVVSVMCVL